MNKKCELKSTDLNKYLILEIDVLFLLLFLYFPGCMQKNTKIDRHAAPPPIKLAQTAAAGQKSVAATL